MSENSEIKLIVGNSNKRFSGVTSTMLQVLPHQQKITNVAVLGNHNLPENTPTLSYWQMLKICRKPLSNGKNRVFHARRNDEMIQALIAKKLFRSHLNIAFTSTAQRHHSKFTKWLMSKMDSIITTCSAAGSYLDPKADITIPHGIDINTYQPAQDRATEWKKLGYPGTFGIGIFGRIRPSKGIDLLIDAAIPVLQDFPQATVIISGETTPKFQSYLEEQKSKIKSAGLSDRILFIGKRPFEELPVLFRSVSVAVAASRNEGYGLTVLEAMASATPVLATEAGAWKDIVINGENGYCVPCDDSSALEDKLRLLIQADIEKLGSAARTHVESSFTTATEANTLTKHLLNLAEKASCCLEN